jgi:hypothetical protein
MKALLSLTACAVLLALAPSPCFALWGIASVSKDEAKGLGLEVRATPTGPNHIVFELEFPTAGGLKDFSRADLRVGKGDNPPVTAPLREERPKPGRVLLRFTADRGHVPNLKLWLMVPEMDGGTIYDVQLQDFVDVK